MEIEPNRTMPDDGGDAVPDRFHRLLLAARSAMFWSFQEKTGARRIRYAPGIEALTGHDTRAFSDDAQLWLKIVHEADQPRLLNWLETLFNGADPTPQEYRITDASGALRWIRKRCLPFYERDDGTRVCEGLCADITEEKQAGAQREALLSQYQEMATRDVMTGLFNRLGFEQEMGTVWNLSRRHNFPVGLLMVDLDHFKSVNDTYGHETGDVVLKEYADIMRAGVREGDTVCRYAGDEIVVILPWADREQAHRIGERLCLAVAEHTFCAGKNDLKLTVSIGVGSAGAALTDTFALLVNRADQALYRAKQEGRNRVQSMIRPSADSPADASVEAAPDEPVESYKPCVLVVDDESGIRNLLRRILERDGCRVWTASDFSGGLNAFEERKGQMDMALVDLDLKGENGMDLIERMRETDPLMPAVVITGLASMERAIEAMRVGACDFIGKPFKPQEITMLVQRAMKQRRLMLENRRYEEHLESMVKHRGHSLAKALNDQKVTMHHMLESMAMLLDVRERNTGEHSRRVTQMAVTLAEEMELGAEEVEDIRKGAMLHDIGKIAIPDTILLKSGPLTEEEWVTMKTHAQIGHDILATSPSLAAAAEIVLSHQEKYDGSGYPRGLKGNEIALGARIFSVVDAYDAMRSKRPYSASLAPEFAREELLRHAGTQFDPLVVDTFLRCQDKLESGVRWT